MKFQGYGQIWDRDKEKTLIDFGSTANKPGIIEVSDERTINILIEKGYKPIEGYGMTENQLNNRNDNFDKQVAKEQWRKAHNGKLTGFDMNWKKTHPEA